MLTYLTAEDDDDDPTFLSLVVVSSFGISSCIKKTPKKPKKYNKKTLQPIKNLINVFWESKYWDAFKQKVQTVQRNAPTAK